MTGPVGGNGGTGELSKIYQLAGGGSGGTSASPNGLVGGGDSGGGGGAVSASSGIAGTGGAGTVYPGGPYNDLGGAGGAGGAIGLRVTAAGTLASSATGGAGGAGQAGGTSMYGSGGGGGGGAGGAALWAPVYVGALSVAPGVVFAGGAGGAGGRGETPGMQGAGDGGGGGGGGDGADFETAETLVNNGTIEGGRGGAGGAGGTGVYNGAESSFKGVAGANGAGGVGILASPLGLTLVNNGLISGGLGGDGVTRADAVTFTGGSNSLTTNGGAYVGALDVAAGATLTLAQTAAAGATQSVTYAAADEFAGAGNLVIDTDSGYSVEIDGANTFSGVVELEAGLLRLGADNTVNGVVEFGPGVGTLALAAGVDAPILYGFASGDALDLTGVGFQAGDQVAFVSQFRGLETWALTNAGSTLATFELTGAYNSFDFTVASDGGGGGTSIGFHSNAARASLFSGGSTSGVLWFNSQSGLALDWALQNGAVSASHPIAGFTPGGGWSLAGRGDFNGDGATDVLLNYTGGGQTTIGTWLLANGVYSQYKSLGGFAANSGWSVRGTGDFNADGTSDVLLGYTSGGNVHLYDWQIVNGAIQQTNNLNMGYATASGWSVLGTGDFNGDGATDVLFFNTQSGLVADWAVSGGTSGAFTSIAGVTPSTGWTFDGVGDFNGDGTSDVLWQNGSTLAIWEVQNGALAQSVTVSTAAPAGFSFAGIGDYFGAGASGILWSNATTGQTEIWRLSNAQVAQTSFPGGVTPGSGWGIVS